MDQHRDLKVHLLLIYLKDLLDFVINSKGKKKKRSGFEETSLKKMDEMQLDIKNINQSNEKTMVKHKKVEFV